MDKYPAIILFGQPGIGKGTQAKLLAEKKDYFHFSSGEMFRGLDPSTELGSRVKALIDGGNYIDDVTTIDLTKETLRHYVAEGRFVPESQYLLLDGLPRTVPQVGLINEFCDVQQVIRLYVHNENAVVERLTRRAGLERRLDDTSEDIVQKRLRVFREQTEPALAAYPPQIIRQINSSASIEEVHERVCEVIIKKGIKKGKEKTPEKS